MTSITKAPRPAEVGGAPVSERSRRLLEVRNLVDEYRVAGRGIAGGGVVQAVSDVSLAIDTGETLGLVGESGCGKSTLARAVLQAKRPARGEVWFRGQDLVTLRGDELRQARRHLQLVAQDPFSVLDPKWRVGRLVEEPLMAHHVGSATERERRVDELLDLVGLDPRRYKTRRPGQLSGGQCQRVAIARALALSPELLVLDEAVSSLDVSIQAHILNLLESLKDDLGLSYLFIGHDLSVVKHVSDRVAVMYLGRLCEIGSAEAIYLQPRHPYTAALLGSIPDPDIAGPEARGAIRLTGEPPSALDPPSGCRFRTRCPLAQERCEREVPELVEVAPDHHVACHFPIGSHGVDRPEFTRRAATTWEGATARTNGFRPGS